MTEEMKYEEIEKLNPFFSIWLSTRKTVRYVLNHKDLKYSLILAAIAGIPNAISAGNEWSKFFSIQLWLLLVGILVLGPILGLVGLGIGTVIYTWVGKWFGGQGTFKEMAQVMGVIMIPSIWLTPYWVLSAIFVRNNIFVMNLPWEVTPGAIIWFFVSSLIVLTSSIWMIVIQSKAVGEVHQFSSWHGFATLILPAIVFGRSN
ncbi:Yip1 family protein [Psychrobacillus vulpis]|uniref:YIP1 family protein n=1 Tax=Psychrobacillus vulpis TaxID=2325572 RepID=A0A544TMN7_9BACI|nr:Yip1 family protein [Psychrobacillus vulpis]TQR18699.1 YIP1 family protein [Psychrobacillus vulpis]